MPYVKGPASARAAALVRRQEDFEDGDKVPERNSSANSVRRDPSASQDASVKGNGRVVVKAYTRRDGTTVREHTRRLPDRKGRAEGDAGGESAASSPLTRADPQALSEMTADSVAPSRRSSTSPLSVPTGGTPSVMEENMGSEGLDAPDLTGTLGSTQMGVEAGPPACLSFSERALVNFRRACSGGWQPWSVLMLVVAVVFYLLHSRMEVFQLRLEILTLF